MDLTLVGIDHHVAPLDVRECLAVPRDEVQGLLRQVRERSWADETMLVATCNRTELYVVTGRTDGAALVFEALASLLPGAERLDETLFRVREGETAARHLFRVAAGLESAILGETESQGQVREAHEAARAAGTAGRILDRLARGALRAGKRARTETDVAAGGVSHGSAAARVARRIFGTVEGHDVLVVGAGAMARQTALALAGEGHGRYVVANRTASHAEELARELPDARVAALEDVPRVLADVHVVVVAGGGGALDRETVRQALPRRREPLLIVDLCVPRMAEPRIGELPGVFLYDLDALEELVAGSLARRREAVPAVEAILAREFADFRAWYRTLEALPAIHSMQAWAEEIRQKELSYLSEDLDESTRGAVEKMTRRLVQKLLGRPVSRVVRGREKQDPSLPTPAHLERVFGLGTENPGPSKDADHVKEPDPS
ncbi:MAG: glutamyl-tRNA reductase [Planctomycetota bacterium]